MPIRRCLHDEELAVPDVETARPLGLHAARVFDEKRCHLLDATRFFKSRKLFEWVKLWYGSGK